MGDRAGFEIQWGCLVFVPAVYTLHTRFSVLNPSGIGFWPALVLFVISQLGVVMNYWADWQRQRFRELNGEMNIFGRKPTFVTAKYTLSKSAGGDGTERTSLLLASGLWGPARHFHYVFELTAAWSWCLLANPVRHGVLPCTYAIFLTILLMRRAKRDEDKCLLKYGEGYKEL